MLEKGQSWWSNCQGNWGRKCIAWRHFDFFGAMTFFCFWGFMNSQDTIFLNKPISLYLWEEYCVERFNLGCSLATFASGCIVVKKKRRSHYNCNFLVTVSGWSSQRCWGGCCPLGQVSCGAPLGCSSSVPALLHRTPLACCITQKGKAFSSHLSINSGLYSAVLGCANKLREMTRSTGHDSKIQTHAVELKVAVRGDTNAG